MRTLCNPAIFRSREIFGILSSYGVEVFKEPCVTLAYLEPWYIQNLRNIENPQKHDVLHFWYIQNLRIFRTQDIRYRESLQHSLHRTLCNLDIFRTKGIFRTLRNIYYEEFYSEPCVTVAYFKSGHNQNPRYVHNTVKQLLWNILFKTLCNPDIFRTLVYLQLWGIQKSKHI